MKKLKTLSLSFILFAVIGTISSCNNDETDLPAKVSTENFKPKDITKIYYGEGKYNSSLIASCNVLLPKLPAGSSYKFYTNEVYNFSYNNGSENKNVVFLFMEIIGIDDYDLSGEKGIMQPEFNFNLSTVSPIPGSIPLDLNKDITLILMHDNSKDLQYGINTYFRKPLFMKLPRKAGMSLVRRSS
jgi:hypothetical protein